MLDGTTGLNMLNQAKEFNETVQLTGLILTKLDGTARGGAVVSVPPWHAGMPAAQTGCECADGLPCFPPRNRCWEPSATLLTHLHPCLTTGWLQVSVVDELGVPVKFVGVGESISDLQPFDPATFVDALFPEVGSAVAAEAGGEASSQANAAP